MMKRINLMWSLFPAVFSLAWPTMLEQLLQTAVQYIDTAMVGSLGTGIYDNSYNRFIFYRNYFRL